VVDGLIDRGISIVSYACDGTEVEHSVQRLFLDLTSKREVKIHNPRQGSKPIVVEFGFYRSQAICMVQDSKHALKTMRNNLFSGACFLIFGNFLAMYIHILEMAFEDGSPLYHRDVIKLDRQDDNAATQLFSAQTLEFLANHHPDYIGIIVYLFVFGELVDAYQNRHITHSERIKLVLRARYFLDSWETYLSMCGYQKDHYFISREASDILRIIIEGFIALVIIHRDHVSKPSPLLPWLHSSEPCEHIFGEAHQIVKDFTFLDLVYMIPKLRLKLHEAVLRGRTSTNPKARAAGYSHTYFDNEGLDLATLSHFPTDEEIDSISGIAAQEADSLITLLGVSPSRLHRSQGVSSSPWLLSINSWLSPDVDDIEADDSDNESSCGEDDSDNHQLQKILDAKEESPFGRLHVTDIKCLSLTSAALALVVEESAVVYTYFFFGFQLHC